MYEEYLMHYGVLGMRWGVRKAAAYVHGRRKKRRADRQQAERERILRSPRKLRKNVSKFSTEEVESAITRFSQQQRLNELSKNKMATGKQKVDVIMSYLNTGTKAAYILGNGIRIGKRLIGENKDRAGAMEILKEMAGAGGQKKENK